eukprot:2003195-Prymnesium_polylepis.1
MSPSRAVVSWGLLRNAYFTDESQICKRTPRAGRATKESRPSLTRSASAAGSSPSPNFTMGGFGFRQQVEQLRRNAHAREEASL